MTEFHTRLKEIRANSHMKQREVAEYLGMKLRSYQSYEIGQTQPPLKKLIALADYFDVTLDYLMGRTDECTGRDGYGTPCKYAAFCKRAGMGDP